MAIGVAVIVVLFPLAINRGVVDEPGRTPSPTTSRATPTPMTTAPPPSLQVLVIGDELTGGPAEDGDGATGWPRIVESELRADGYDVTVDVSMGDGSGYTEPGEVGATFGQRAETAPPGYDLVVFVGGASDEAGLQVVEEAAYRAYLSVWDVTDTTYMLVVGPATFDADPPPSVLTTRQAVLAASQRAGIPFIDPIRQGWLQGQDGDLVDEDDVHPTEAGHRRVADRILPVLRPLIRQVVRDPAITGGG
jgi:lysophospholipase L1-like esterase